MIRRIVVYGFPLIFVLAEYLLRNVFHSDARGFIAPTLASVGIGQLFPLIALKDRTSLLPAKARQALKGKRLVSNADKFVTDIAWILIFLFTFLWSVLLYLSINNAANPADPVLLGYKTVDFGLVTYFVGVILAEVKEWV